MFILNLRRMFPSRHTPESFNIFPFSHAPCLWSLIPLLMSYSTFIASHTTPPPLLSLVPLPLSPNSKAMQDPPSSPVNGKHLQVEQIWNHTSDAAVVTLAEASRRLHLNRACHLHLLSLLHCNQTFTLRTLDATSASIASDPTLTSVVEEV
jgi:hypothetical protein